MKKIFTLVISLLLFLSVFSQIPKSLQKKEETKLEFIFRILDENSDTLTEYQIASLLDSLDRKELKKPLGEEYIYKINEKDDTIYSIGDKAQGGIVFWVDDSGQHGLVAFEDDQASEVFPYYIGEKYIKI